MLEWHAVSSETYYAALDSSPASLSDENLYFLTDTKEIYRGSSNFTESLVIYTGTKPDKPARGKIYVDATTLKGEIYTGAAWVEVIKPVVSTVTADGVDPVSGKAVSDYVATEIGKISRSDNILSNIAYNDSSVTITATKANGDTIDLTLNGLGKDLSYVSSTGVLELKDQAGKAIAAVNLDLERFVVSGKYEERENGTTGKTEGWIVLTIGNANGTTSIVEFPVTDLIDIYTAKAGKTVAITVTNNEFTAEVIKSGGTGNAVEMREDGIYVATTDLSTYQTLVENASTTMIPMLDDAGQVINGTMTPGGATIAAMPNATTLATELAVNTLIASTKATIDASLATKMALVTGATENNIATFNAAGQVKDSTVKVGGAALATSPDASTLATELAVNTKITSVESALDSRITTNTGAIATLNGDVGTPGSVDKKIADATAKMLESTDLVTVINNTATDDQVASAKSVYDTLTWKTEL